MPSDALAIPRREGSEQLLLRCKTTNSVEWLREPCGNTSADAVLQIVIRFRARSLVLIATFSQLYCS